MTASRAPLRQIAARPVSHPVPKVRPQVKPSNRNKLLQRLHLIQHCAVATALLLTGGVFVVYGSTVHSQKRWNQQYTKLEHLKQLEGRLINAAEALNHDRVQQAWQSETLVRETPDRVIFVEAAPPRPPVTPEPPSQKSSPTLPVAY